MDGSEAAGAPAESSAEAPFGSLAANAYGDSYLVASGVATAVLDIVRASPSKGEGASF